MTAILKDVVLNNEAGADPAHVFLYVTRASGGYFYLLIATLAALEVVTFAGRFVVMEPGDEFHIFSDVHTGGDLHVSASGALLDGVV